MRRCGWTREAGTAEPRHDAAALLIDGGLLGSTPGWLPSVLRPRALVLGLRDSTARADWLALGFADALPVDLTLEELHLRASRTLAAGHDQRCQTIGALRLDLVLRDGLTGGRRLRLHPREFALLWRLAEHPGQPVGRAKLLRDVFDLAFDPGTNSLAVHICRLRKKLALAGLPGLVATTVDGGGYRLDLQPEPPLRAASPLAAANPLDPSARLREQSRTFEETAP